MHSLSVIKAMNYKADLKFTVLKLKQSKGFQKQRYYYLRRKYFDLYGEML